MEINGIAHIVLRVSRFVECVAFYDQLMPRLGLRAVNRSEGLVYYVGGRTAVGIRPAEANLADHAHRETAPGIDHICFRARSREEIDELFRLIEALGAEIVRAPEEGPWAPGYYSFSFRDPEGIRLEVNHVPGEGVFAKGAAFDPAPDYPLVGRSQPDPSVAPREERPLANPEIVRRIFDAVANRESDAVLNLYDPDVVWDVSRHPMGRLMAGSAIYRGHEGLRRFFREEWYQAWENAEHELEELTEVGDDTVVAVVTDRGRGRSSGVEVELGQHASVWILKNGRVTKVIWFSSHREALEAAGLTE